MFPCLCAQGSSVAEHLNVVAELPGIPGVLHICEGDRSFPPVYFAFVERTGGSILPGLVPRTAQWLAYLQQ